MIGQMRDMNTHLAKVTGKDRHAIKVLRFSEVYGVGRDDMVEDYGERGVQLLTMRFIMQYPQVAGYARLLKSRARMMVEALRSTCVEKGNIQVLLTASGTYCFYYRNTSICTWNPLATSEAEEFKDVDAGEFEHTPSNRNQRNMVRHAVEEFKQVVLCL